MRFWIALLFLAACCRPAATAQTNDNFANRLALSGPAPVAASNNLLATREAGEPDHAGAAAGRSLWYTWTAPATGTVNVSTYYTGTGAPTMRAVALYTGNALSSLSEVASSNNLAQTLYLEGFLAPGSLPGTSINVPVTAGTVYQIAIDALDFGRTADDGTVVLAINPPPTILSAANVAATTGAGFAYAITATGGPTAYAASNLPAGLSLNPVSGQITGVITAAGTYPVGLSATGPGGTGTATVTLSCSDPVAAAPVVPAFENNLSQNGYVGQTFSGSLTATGSPTAYAATNLPVGLSLNTASGLLSGTPTTAGVYTVPISATGAGGTGAAVLTINIAAVPPPPVIISALAAAGTTGTAFDYYIETNLDGYTGLEPTAYAATNLPPGLSLTQNTGSAYFNGTPTQAGVYPVGISVTNGAGTRQATVTVTITAPAAAPASAPPVLTSSAAAVGTVGATFAYTLSATQSPTSFGAGSLPPGVAFNAATGAFAGTPTAAGTFLVPVTAANAFGTSNGTLTVTIAASAAALSAANGLEQPVIVSPAAAYASLGQGFTYGIVAEFGGSPYLPYPPGGNTTAWTFSATGLPPGLSVSASGSPYGDGTISGTPTKAGVYQATISATCPAGYSEASTGTAVVTFIVGPGSAPVAPVITSSASGSYSVGNSGYYYTGTTGSPTGYAASNLPPGMSINATSGTVSGTPTAAGTYAATISATNAVGTGSATVQFLVASQSNPALGGAATAAGTVGSYFFYSISGSNATIGYAASNLPPGLTFSTSNGTLTGAPTQAGVYIVPISATNAAGTVSATLTITISPAALRPPAIISYAVATGTTGQSFAYYLSTDTTAASYAAGGTLPPGLTFSTSSGVLTGTPTQAGTYTVPVSATNSLGTGSAVLTVVITNPALPVFTTASALAATVGQAFGSSVAATNYPTSYTFSGLPPGITQSSSSPGYLSGTPTAAGVYTVAVSAGNVSGTAAATLTITVAPAATPAAPVIQGTAGATVAVGAPFQYTLQATGAPTSYSLATVPPGLTFNPTTGILAGAPTAAGTYPLAFTATNAGGTAQASVNLVVSAGSGTAVPLITSQAGAVAYDNESFYLPITATGSPTSYAATNLLPGLSINPATGVISGQPTSSGGNNFATVSATNAAGTGTGQVNISPAYDPSPSHFTSACTAAGTVNVAFSGALTCNAYVYSYSATGLPPGLLCNTATGIVSGTPTTAGTYTATLSASTQFGTASGRMAFVIGSAAATRPTITSAAGAGGYVGLPLAYVLTGSNSPTSFAASGLPAGLALNAATGVISGTPTAAATTVVTVTATNGAGSTSGSLTFNIATASSTVVEVTSASSAAGFVGAPMSYAVTLAPASSLTVSYGGSLPPGITYNSATRTFSGTPTTAGTYPVSLSTSYAYAQVNFVIGGPLTDLPTITSAAGAAGMVGSAFSYVVSASNAPTAYTAGSLPPGLTFNAATGTLAGTPTTAGTYTIPLTAANAAGTAGGTLTLAVANTTAPSLASASNALERTFAVGTASGTAATWYINASNATSFAASGLPPGLSLNTATGQLTGTLTTAGTYPARVSASNAVGTVSAVVTYVITSATASPPVLDYFDATYTAYVGVPVSTSLQAANSPTSYAASGLPPGFVLNATTGAVTGTPTAAGTYTVTVSAANAAGTGTAVWTVLVGNASALYPVFSELSAETTGNVGTSFYDDLAASVYGYGSSVANAQATLTVSGLPPGLTATAEGNGELDLSGTPTTAGSYTVNVTATAPGGATSSASTLIVIASATTMKITSAAGAAGNLHSAFGYSLYASGTITAYTAGNLPAGLALNASTGAISGVPTATGTYVVPVSATGPYGSAAATLTIRIDPPLYGGLPVVTSAAAISSQDFTNDGPFYVPGPGGPAVSYTLTASDASATFTVGSLPAGLVFNPYLNTISGQPVATGIFQVPVTAANAVGSTSAVLTIISTSPAVTPAIALAQSGFVGGTYNGQVAAFYLDTGYAEENEYFYLYDEGVPDPVTFTAAGLPPGLSLNGYEGQITGTFTSAGTFPVTVTATNRAGSSSVVCTFFVAGTAPAGAGITTVPVFYGQAEAAGFVGTPLSYYLSANGASAYAATGLPAGLALNASTGQISGTPTVAGSSAVTVSATNAAGTTQALLTVTVDAAPALPILDAACAATATVGTPFYYYIYADNYSALPSPTGYAASGLPAGLSLSAAGEISGTPTGPAGVYSVPITVAVGPATSAGGVLTLTVRAAPAVAPSPVMTSAAGALGFVDNPFSYTIQNAAFVPAAGSLPAGLAYNAATGVISGYPAAAGTYVVPLAVTGTGSSNGSSGSSSNGKSSGSKSSGAVRKSSVGKAVRKSSVRSSPVLADSGTAAGGTSTLTIGVLAPDLSLPRLTAQPAGGTATEGASFAFTGAAVGAPAPTYQWSQNGVPLPGANGPSLELAGLLPAETGNYTLTAANAAGSVTSNAAALLVLTSYAQWQSDHFTAAQIAAGSAADGVSLTGDGVPNLLKYALGLDPQSNASADLPAVGRDAADGALQIAFDRDAGKPDIDYLVEVSPDLQTWTVIAQSVGGAPVVGVNGGGTATETTGPGSSQVQVVVTANPPANGPAQFLRLRIDRP